jgi:glucokinase
MPPTPWIGIDIGATKILGCVVDSTGAIIKQNTVPTPPADSNAIEDALFDMARSLLVEHNDAQTLGIALAGWVDRSRRTVLFSPHLPWHLEPLADNLSTRLGLAVILENDANAAAWGEHKFGAGKDFQDFILVTIGSGIGAGIVAGGLLLRGAHGLAGELGHTVVEPEGPWCPCGRRGCVDSFASGRALQRHFQELRGQGSDLAETPPEFAQAPVTGDSIAAAARDGDPVALQAFATVGEYLGRGIADLVMCLDPAAVILGGGVATAGELLRGPTDASLRRCLVAHEKMAETQVLIGLLGASAGALGVAHLASRQGEHAKA